MDFLPPKAKITQNDKRVRLPHEQQLKWQIPGSENIGASAYTGRLDVIRRHGTWAADIMAGARSSIPR
jgi:hypothetical protein